MSSRVVFFDLETGGLDPQVHPVIHFAGVAVDEAWCPVDEMEVLIAFDEDQAGPEALQKNNYDPERWLREAVPPARAVGQISAFLRRHATLEVPKKSGRGTWLACELAGHNAQSFDRPFLGELFRAHGEFCVGTFQVLDTYSLALWWRALLPAVERPENLRLPTLAAHFGIEHPEAHDALADVRVNVEVAKRLLADAWGRRL